MSKVTWAAPVANTDGSAIAAGEITGYEVGIWTSTDTTQTPAFTVNTAANVLTADLSTLALAKGVQYYASVRVLGPVDSDWFSPDAQVPVIPLPKPNPPSGFSVA